MTTHWHFARLLIALPLSFGAGAPTLSAQTKSSTKPASATKPAPTAPVLCRGGQLPAGQVVVEEIKSDKCPDGVAVVVKTPGDTERVCDTSPVPEGYYVEKPAFSKTCIGLIPDMNALIITRQGQTSDLEQGFSEEQKRERRRAEVAAIAAAPAAPVTDVAQEARAQAINEAARADLARRAWKEKVDQAIKEGKLLLGMTEDEVRRSWGNPSSVSASIMGSGTTTRWFYRRNGRTILLRFDETAVLDYIGL